MLISMEGAGLCAAYPGFIVAPLPAKRTLWEAPTAEAWRSERNWNTNDREMYGMSLDGKLLKMHQDNGLISCSPESWDNWLPEMDSFGILIMIAASLL